MIHFAKKMEFVESSLRFLRGDFELFCLVELKDNPGQWDIVASAAWLPDSETEATGFLIDIVFDLLAPEELESLGRVVVLPPDEPFVNSILETGMAQISDHVVHGMEISQLYVISPGKNSKSSRFMLTNYQKQQDSSGNQAVKPVSTGVKSVKLRVNSTTQSINSKGTILNFQTRKQNNKNVSNNFEGERYVRYG